MHLAIRMLVALLKNRSRSADIFRSCSPLLHFVAILDHSVALCLFEAHPTPPKHTIPLCDVKALVSVLASNRHIAIFSSCLNPTEMDFVFRYVGLESLTYISFPRLPMPTSSEIRQQFIDFFCQKHGHTFVPSSPVVPHDDPTLLFTNAGMNQFKDVFLGTGTRPYKRAANTQKCIRAGGKHNDLDDVGKDTYHHTFFEMLGNWSFGDYFKKEAIQWAWELLTSKEWWGLDKERLHVTVFEGDPENKVPRDDEAAKYWREVAGVDASHIHLGNKKDNFWEMGETGPCGPCTEIHYDSTKDKSGAKLVNKGTPDVIEIWNLVFIQYNRNADKSLTPLPAKHVDTGMGFERITKILQGKESNYDTDVFTPLIGAIEQLFGKKYGGKLEDDKDISFRVIADHLRMVTFAITDGEVPSNKERGSVVRTVLRRAVAKGYVWFDQREPFLFKAVPVLVDQMGHAFPELKNKSSRVQEVIREEETNYLQILADGAPMVEDIAKKQIQGATMVQGTVQAAGFPAEKAFVLATTHGIPLELTVQIAGKYNQQVDLVEVERKMEEFRKQSGEGRKKVVVSAIQGHLPKTDDSPKYSGLTFEASILGWVEDNVVTSGGLLLPGKTVGLVLDQTCFYAEQGGQVGDTGVITGGTGQFIVERTQKLGDTVLHIGQLPEGMLEVGQIVKLQVNGQRFDIMKNHTATHLLNLALRQVLGEHVEQKGSLVDAEKTRFDFAHDKPLSAEEIEKVEAIVNEQIQEDRPVTPVIMPLAEAKKIPGVRAVFGEKYPDPVRVLLIGPDNARSVSPNDSVEFCGGTHLNRTSQAGLFKIVSQEAVGKGVRRVTAVAGRKAVEYVRNTAKVIGELTDRFRCSPEEVPARVESLQEEVKKLQTQLKKGVSGDLTAVADRLLNEAPTVGGAKVIIGEMPGGPIEQIRAQMDRLISKAGSCVIVLSWADDDKVGLRAVVTNDLQAKGLHAGNLIKEMAPIVGGKGGGKPDKAEAGGKEPAKVREALEKARTLVMEKLN
jgi:alanyl-tRNA synthetase